MPLVFGDCTFDRDRRELTRAGSPVHAGPKVLRLLELLVDARPSAMTKDEIHTLLWSGTFVSDGTPAGIARCQAALAGNGALCDQGVDPQHQYSGLVRLTYQATPRNKLSVYYDRIHKSRGAAMNPGDDQTTSSVVWNSPNYHTASVKWTSTVSNKLLVEGAKFADEHGLTAVWTPERHFHPFGGLFPNPAVSAAALAMITKHVQLRAGSFGGAHVA